MVSAVTFIIAEAGVNHNGNMRLALELIDAAKRSGANAVKFQTFIAEEEIATHAEKAEYQIKNTGSKESQLEMVKRLELDNAQHIELRDHCKRIGIEFMSSAFDLKSVAMLEEMKLDRWKVPSGEITNMPYLRRIGSLGMPVILSTGMSNLGEVEAAIDILIKSGTERYALTVMHCTTDYPTSPSDVNLRAMVTIREAFKVSVGYSDHTSGISIPIAAVSLGASVIEKHLTLDKNLDGPDHKASLEPEEFKAMVTAIREVECALGDGIKQATQSERANIRCARKSLVAATEILKGERFSEKNLTAKRPGTGLSPMMWDEWIGKNADRHYRKDDLVGCDE